MNDNLPSYAERTDAVMARLHQTLAPSTVEEQVLVDWFRQSLDLAHCERLAAMVARAVADAYDRGRRELIDDLREVGGLTIPADYSAATAWQRVRDIIEAERRP